MKLSRRIKAIGGSILLGAIGFEGLPEPIDPDELAGKMFKAMKTVECEMDCDEEITIEP